MSATPLRGILYGHGRMGQFHAAKLAERSDIAFSVVDPKAGFSTVPKSKPDFAIVATPTSTHANVAWPLLKQGVPCLIEKPLASSLDEAERLAQFTHLCVGHIERFNPVFSTLGQVDTEYIEVERLSSFSQRSTDVDVIDDLMIHDLDLLTRFMPGPIIDIRAKGIGVMTKKPDIVNVRLEIQIPDGRIGVVNMSASRVSPRSVRTWRLIEPGRYWSLDLKHHTAKVVEWENQDMSSRPIPIAQEDALTAQHNAFFDAIRKRGSFACTGKDALQALQLAERIRTCLA